MVDDKKQFQYAMDMLGVKVLNDDYVEWRTCKTKKRHTTIGNALKAAYAGATGHGAAYQCPFCGGFHVGHKTGTKRTR